MTTSAAAGVDAFLGAWRLVPAESRYEHGAPPHEAVYRIERDGEWLLFAARWVDAHGRRLEMSFAGIPDGEAHPYDDPSVADAIIIRMPDARTLESVAERERRVVAVGRRVLSDDGRRMTITQSGATPAGASFAIVSVYERA